MPVYCTVSNCSHQPQWAKTLKDLNWNLIKYCEKDLMSRAWKVLHLEVNPGYTSPNVQKRGYEQFHNRHVLQNLKRKWSSSLASCPDCLDRWIIAICINTLVLPQVPIPISFTAVPNRSIRKRASKRGFHKLSTIQECHYCQLHFSFAFTNELD